MKQFVPFISAPSAKRKLVLSRKGSAWLLSKQKFRFDTADLLAFGDALSAGNKDGMEFERDTE